MANIELIGNRIIDTIQVSAGATVYLYGNQYDTLNNSGTVVLMDGDRAKVTSGGGGGIEGSGDENNVVFWDADGNVKDISGIGYDVATDSLGVIGDTIYSDYGETLISRGYFDLRRSSDSYNPFLVFWRKRQTGDAVQSGDLLGRISAYGHDGTDWSSGSRARVNLKASQNWSSGKHGTKIEFEVTPNDSETPSLAASIDSEGWKNEISNLLRTKDYTIEINSNGVASADTLDGQHGSYYRDASNINAGTLSTDRFSAYSGLVAESKIGLSKDEIVMSSVYARSNPYNYSINIDFTSGDATQLPSGWAWATNSPFASPVSVTVYKNTIWRIYNGSNRNCFLYRSPTIFTYSKVGAAFTVYALTTGNYAGVRVDDGTNNNYIRIVLRLTSTGFKFYRESASGGTPQASVELTKISNLIGVPFAMLGWDANDTTINPVIWNYTGSVFAVDGGIAWWFTPARYGFELFTVSTWESIFIDCIFGFT